MDDTTALVIFDNLNYIASIDLSFKNRKRNRLFPAPSLGSGFEDIAVDIKQGRAFCLIEALEDFDGVLRGFVAEYDREYPVMGTEEYDHILMKRISARTAEAVLSHAGRVYGTARRVINDSGKSMTITFKREGSGTTVNNTALYEKLEQ